VITPQGIEIYYGNDYDEASQGQLDGDDIPHGEVGSYVEHIYFPLDGSAPAGTYEYFIHDFSQSGEADNWNLAVITNGIQMQSHAGSGDSSRFTVDF